MVDGIMEEDGINTGRHQSIIENMVHGGRNLRGEWGMEECYHSIIQNVAHRGRYQSIKQKSE